MARYTPHRSLASLLAIGFAIASFFVSPATQVLLAAAAIFFGVIGFLLSFLPGTRGGLISILAMLLGILGGGVAILKAVLHLLTQG